MFVHVLTWIPVIFFVVLDFLGFVTRGQIGKSRVTNHKKSKNTKKIAGGMSVVIQSYTF